MQDRFTSRLTYSFWIKTLLAGTLLLPFLPVDVYGEPTAADSKPQAVEQKPADISLRAGIYMKALVK